MRKWRLKLTNDPKENSLLELKQQFKENSFKYLTREVFSLGFENPSTTCLGKLHGNAFLAGNSIYIHTASLRGNLEKSSSQKQHTRKVIILLVERRGSERMDAVRFLLPCQIRMSSANKGDPSINWLYQRTWNTSLFFLLAVILRHDEYLQQYVKKDTVKSLGITAQQSQHFHTIQCFLSE